MNIHLLVLPLKVLVAGNDPLFSKETRGEIDVDSQVNHLAGKFLHLVYRSTPVYSQMYTGIHKSVKKYTQMCTQKGSKEYKCIHKYLHKYTQIVEKYT